MIVDESRTTTIKPYFKSAYYHLSDHIYIAKFRDELIFLDTKQDIYTVCSQQFSKLLIRLLEAVEGTALVSDHQFSSQNLELIEKLKRDKIIQKKDMPYPYHIYQNSDANGVSNVNWSLPLHNKNIPLDGQVLKALYILIKVHLYIKIRGFYYTIQWIKNHKSSELNYIIPQDTELKELADIVNKACLLYPTRTKCLEWSMTFVLLALKKQWKCNLEIGVQNYPFLAHAWVECNNKVIMDLQDLREGLTIILNEPFRKLRI